VSRYWAETGRLSYSVKHDSGEPNMALPEDLTPATTSSAAGSVALFCATVAEVSSLELSSTTAVTHEGRYQSTTSASGMFDCKREGEETVVR
jgi:hypothetical protein